MWKGKFETVDFHCHVLPGMDDGSKNPEISAGMLKMMQKQGIDTVLATSHYYNFDENITSFINRRRDAFMRLEGYIAENDLSLPKIIPSAEVRIYYGMHEDPDLDKLCIGNSRYILLEMPYETWSDWMFAEIYSLTAIGYIPIMAHVERFYGIVKAKVIEEQLLPLDVLVQCNAEGFLNFRQRRIIHKFIKNGRLTVIGSDSHGVDYRPPKIGDAMEYIEKKYGEDYLKHLMNNASKIITS